MLPTEHLPLADMLAQLGDKDLSSLAYLIEQAEGRQEDQGCTLRGRPDEVAREIKAAAWRREKTAQVTLRSPMFERSVTLKAGPQEVAL